jgi:hypothetical protein
MSSLGFVATPWGAINNILVLPEIILMSFSSRGNPGLTIFSPIINSALSFSVPVKVNSEYQVQIIVNTIKKFLKKVIFQDKFFPYLIRLQKTDGGDAWKDPKVIL